MDLRGRGKTTIATIISNYTQRNIQYIQGSLLVNKSDILMILANIKENDIIFIDEIHSMNKNIEELIYSAMEDNVVDIPIGPDGEKRIVRMKIKPFTLICATTMIDRISKPIKDRFGMIFKIDNYQISDIAKIIVQSSKILQKEIKYDQAKIIALYSQESPRIANRIIKRIIDFANYYNEDINEQIINKTLQQLSIYKLGLVQMHIDYLKLLLDVFEQKSVALNVISSLLNVTKNEIINEIEPILLSKKLIVKTSKGRRITSHGVKYLLEYKINPFIV